MPDRPQIDQDLAERLAAGMFTMTGFDFLSIVYMISAEATTAAVGLRNDDASDQEIIEGVTDAINEWMNVQKDFIFGFENGDRPPAELVREAAERSGYGGSE